MLQSAMANDYRTLRFVILPALLVVSLFPNSTFAGSLYEGGWRVPDTGQYYTLVWPELKQAKTFELNCFELVDGKFAFFDILVDKNHQIIQRIGEAGGAFISGKSVSIRKSSQSMGKPHHCTWKIIEHKNVVEQKVQWFHRPGLGQILLGAFSEQRRFRVDFSLMSTGCENGQLRVMVDGKQVTNFKGEQQILLEGSSFVGEGKIISIALSSGNCKDRSFFGGSFSIKQP